MIPFPSAKTKPLLLGLILVASGVFIHLAVINLDAIFLVDYRVELLNETGAKIYPLLLFAGAGFLNSFKGKETITVACLAMATVFVPYHFHFAAISVPFLYAGIYYIAKSVFLVFKIP